MIQITWLSLKSKTIEAVKRSVLASGLIEAWEEAWIDEAQGILMLVKLFFLSLFFNRLLLFLIN